MLIAADLVATTYAGAVVRHKSGMMHDSICVTSSSQHAMDVVDDAPSNAEEIAAFGFVRPGLQQQEQQRARRPTVKRQSGLNVRSRDSLCPPIMFSMFGESVDLLDVLVSVLTTMCKTNDRAVSQMSTSIVRSIRACSGAGSGPTVCTHVQLCERPQKVQEVFMPCPDERSESSCRSNSYGDAQDVCPPGRATRIITRFDALNPPHVPIRAYLERIFQYSGCSDECFVMGLIYMDRIISTHEGFLLSSWNVHRMLITTIMCAAKFFDDSFYNNAHYARMGGVSKSEINDLEMEFLFMCGFNLFVSTVEFRQYWSELESHAQLCLQHRLVEKQPTTQRFSGTYVCTSGQAGALCQAPAHNDDVRRGASMGEGKSLRILNTGDHKRIPSRMMRRGSDLIAPSYGAQRHWREKQFMVSIPMRPASAPTVPVSLQSQQQHELLFSCPLTPIKFIRDTTLGEGDAALSVSDMGTEYDRHSIFTPSPMRAEGQRSLGQQEQQQQRHREQKKQREKKKQRQQKKRHQQQRQSGRRRRRPIDVTMSPSQISQCAKKHMSRCTRAIHSCQTTPIPDFADPEGQPQQLHNLEGYFTDDDMSVCSSATSLSVSSRPSSVTPRFHQKLRSPPMPGSVCCSGTSTPSIAYANAHPVPLRPTVPFSSFSSSRRLDSRSVEKANGKPSFQALIWNGSVQPTQPLDGRSWAKVVASAPRAGSHRCVGPVSGTIKDLHRQHNQRGTPNQLQPVVGEVSAPNSDRPPPLTIRLGSPTSAFAQVWKSSSPCDITYASVAAAPPPVQQPPSPPVQQRSSSQVHTLQHKRVRQDKQRYRKLRRQCEALPLTKIASNHIVQGQRQQSQFSSPVHFVSSIGEISGDAMSYLRYSPGLSTMASAASSRKQRRRRRNMAKKHRR